MIWTLEKVEELANGGMWRKQWDKWDRIRKLNPKERAAYEQAKEQGYLMDVARNRVELVNVWWHYCGVLRIPYVVLRLKRRWGSLNLDLMPTDGSDCGVPHELYISGGCTMSESLVEEFLKAWRDIAIKGKRQGVSASGGAHMIWMELQKEYLEPFARMIVDRVRPLVESQKAAAEAKTATLQ